MNRDEIAKLLPELQVFLKTFRIFSSLFIISVFGSYILAFWLWSQNQTLYAFLLASLAFLAFYTLQTKLAEFSCRYLNQEKKYNAMVEFIRKNLKKKTAKEFLTQLEKATAIVKKN